MAFFPTLNPGVLTALQVIITSMRENPGYLDDPECQYSEDVKALFRGLMNVDSGEAPSLKDPKDAERQIEILIHSIDQTEKKMTDKDHAERLAYFRLKASLLEKLIGLKERILNLREMADFQSVVLGFLDEICNKDQVSELMLRLRNIQEVAR